MKRLILNLILALICLPGFISAQNCYTVIESNTGIPSIYTEDLDQKACELLSLVNGFDDDDSQTENAVNFNFEVIGCDFYPILAYVSQVQEYNRLFDKAITELEASKESFAMVTKEYDYEGNITYRAHIKFPTGGNFDLLTPFEKEGISNLFLQTIKNHATEDQYDPTLSSDAEAAGLDKLIELFGHIMVGTLDLGAQLMELAGFESAPIGPNENFDANQDFANGDPELFGENVVYDYSGLKMGGQRLRDKVSVSLDGPITSMNSFSHAYIITDKTSTDSELASAQSTFKNTEEKVIIWMHFELNDVGVQEATDSVYIRYGNNLTFEDAEMVVNEMFNYYMSKWLPGHFDSSGPIYTLHDGENGFGVRNNDCDGNGEDCSLGWNWGATCLMPKVGSGPAWFPGLQFQAGLAIGLFDGLLGTVQVFYESGKSVKDVVSGWWESIVSYTKELVQVAIAKGSMLAVLEKVVGDSVEAIKAAWNQVVEIYRTLRGFLETFTWEAFQVVIAGIYQGIEKWMGELLSGDKCPAYDIGVIAFDLILTFFSGGTAAGATFLPRILKWIKGIHQGPYSTIVGMMNKIENGMRAGGAVAKKAFRCRILGKGCFVQGTPVLIADKAWMNSKVQTFKNTAKGIAFATMPIVAMPIEEVQLLDYAVVHETVNTNSDLTASVDAIDLLIQDKDPYTSDQQRDRDQYNLDDDNWYEVVFEEINGDSYCKLALHKDWMNEQGGFEEGAIHILNLPEQGINGPNRVVSIKHIIPQKIPVDGDLSDGYGYQPVTGVFVHQSSQVWNLTFDNQSVLGVTYNHPIYSSTIGDWKMAGELEIGESVLTKSGEATVAKKEKVEGVHTVYNLEVRSLHNFLVGDGGIVVHNTCFLDTEKLMRELTGRSYQKTPGSKQKINRSKAQDHDKIKNKYPDAYKDDDGNLLVCFDDFGFPDFGPFAEIIVEIDMNGNSNDFTQAVEQAQSQIPGVKRHGTVIDGITYTWHHHQDGKSMMLVPSDINNTGRGGISHTGGNTLVKKGLKGKDNPFATANNPRNSKCN